MTQPVQVHLYTLIEQAVEAGATHGYRRAFKHSDALDAWNLIDAIVQGVMLELSEVIDFDARAWRDTQESPAGFGESFEP